MVQPWHLITWRRKHPAFGYTPPRYLTWLRWGLGGLALGFTVAIAYVGLWFYMAMVAQDYVELWADARRAEGFAVAYNRSKIHGFPGPVQVDLTNPTLGAPTTVDGGQARPWVWQGKRLNIKIYPLSWPLNVTRMAFDAAGEHRVTVNGPGGLRTYEGAAERIVIDGKSENGQLPERVRVDIENLAFLDTQGGDRFSVSLAVAEMVRHNTPLIDLSQPNTSATLTLKGLRLPRAYVSPLGPDVDAVKIDAQLMGGFHMGPLVEGLAAWRDAGGTIEILSAKIAHGPLVLSGDGTLALDGTLQPIGAFNTRTTGFFDALDRLSASGTVTSGDAAMAKIVLGAMAKRREKGGPLVLSLPLTAQNQTLYAGPVPVAKLPTVAWSYEPFPGTQNR